MDASLPSWRQLIERLEDLLLDATDVPDFRAHASTDPQRRAEQLLHLKRPSRPLSHALYQALYEGDENSPGLLAEAIARLVAASNVDIELITTNFDSVLEKALQAEMIEVQSYSLHGTRMEDGNQPADNLDAWLNLTPDERSKSVLHIHGMVTRRTVRDPLILDEASFFMYGREIQDLLASRFEGSTVLLFGLSMTDPNVVAPLRATKEKHLGGQRFFLSVPSIPRHKDAPVAAMESAARFAVKNALLFGEDLRVHTLLFKSYGQLIQMASDLPLEVVGLDKEAKSRYGVRFQTALKDAYRALGCSLKTGQPKSFDAARRLSQLMRRASREDGGPLDLLKSLREKYSGECSSYEKFGIFLWLREPGGSIIKSRYEVRLVASSTYVHWDSWSIGSVEPVASESRYSPATALYYGRPTSRNIPMGARGVWRGTFAVPLIQYAASSDQQSPAGTWLDQLSLGAVAINSTKCVEFTDDLELEDTSVMAVISRKELEDLQGSIREFAESIF